MPFSSTTPAVSDGFTLRWDTTSVTVTGPNEVTTDTASNVFPNPETRGSLAYTTDRDSSMLTATSGKFNPKTGKIRGDGTWKITPTVGSPTSGSFKVTKFIDFHLAGGILPSVIGGTTIVDLVGRNKDARAGALNAQIEYSDGTIGIMLFGCRLPVGDTPPASDLFEGVLMTKGFTMWWEPDDPKDGNLLDVPQSNTLLHVLD